MEVITAIAKAGPCRGNGRIGCIVARVASLVLGIVLASATVGRAQPSGPAARRSQLGFPSTTRTVTRTGPAGAIRGAMLRGLAVAALALAGLLVFGLLPGGRGASAVTPSPQPLPAAPAVHYLHPHGPNRAPHH